MRKVVQLVWAEGHLFALCEDGKIWKRVFVRHRQQREDGTILPESEWPAYDIYKWIRIKLGKSREAAKPPLPCDFADDVPLQQGRLIEVIKQLRGEYHSELKHTRDALYAANDVIGDRLRPTIGDARRALEQMGYRKR